MTDPYPDGDTKVVLDFPYRPGMHAAELGDFRLLYAFLNTVMLQLAGVFWRPGSPRYPQT